jgi:glycosyltransferase involved in cell wall biosynthesis
MISICLATFDGEQFLKKQLDTILVQIDESDEVIVVDDCSSDSTVKLIKEIGDKRIKITLNNKNTGALKAFERAISLAKGDYIFLSDQDDAWFPDKIKVTFMKMRELEMLYGDTIPLLVHTDLAVGDENLKIISKSFCKFQMVKPWLYCNDE